MSRDALSLLQADFQDYILGHAHPALARVASTPELPAKRRLDIYYNAYRVRLGELLADTFERVLRYIGDEAFDRVANDFIELHTPVARNLRFYGGEFPDYLSRRFADDGEVAELAAMDWRLRHTFDAPDAAVLVAADLAHIAPEAWDALMLRLHPTASLLSFHWNSPAIWQSVNEDQTPPAAARAAQAVPWLFWRKDWQPHFRSLASEEHMALLAICAGKTFGEVCHTLLETCPQIDVATQVGIWLRGWLDEGVLRSFD